MISELIRDVLDRLWGGTRDASASTWLDRYYAQEKTPPDTKKELNALAKNYDTLTNNWLALDQSSRSIYEDSPDRAAAYYKQAAGKLTSRERALESAANAVYGRLAPGDRAAYKAVRQHYRKRLDAVHALADAYKDPKRDFKESQKEYEKDPRRFKAVSELKRVASVGKSMPDDADLSDYTAALADYSETEDLAEGLSALQEEPATKQPAKSQAKGSPTKSTAEQDESIAELLHVVLSNQRVISERIYDLEARIAHWQYDSKQPPAQKQTVKQPAKQPAQRPVQKQPKPSPDLGKAYGEYAQLMLSVAGYKNPKKIDAIANKFAGGEMTYDELRNRLQGGIYRRRMKESMGGRVAPPGMYYTILSTAAYEEATKGIDDSGKDFQAWRDQMESDGDAAKKYFDKQREIAKAKEAAEAQKSAPSHDAPSHEADNEAEVE